MNPIAYTARLLRDIVSGHVTLHALERTWDEVYAGNAYFRCSTGDTLVVFNDCDSYDYIDSVITHDGECFQFQDLYPFGQHNLDAELKSTNEFDTRLLQRLKDAPILARSHDS